MTALTIQNTTLPISHKLSSRIPVHVTLVLLVYLEMLVLLEGRIQREHHVQRFHQRVVDAGVDRNIQDIAGHSAVVSQGKVDILAGGRNIVQKLFHL